MLKATTFTTEEESLFLHGKFKHLVAKLTSEMRTREDKKQKWRHLKKQWNDELNEMMGIDPKWGVKAGQLFSFDLDARYVKQDTYVGNATFDVTNGILALII